MTLVPLPASADNSIWMLQHGRDAIVVDPGEAEPVFTARERGHLQLAAILVTHHPIAFFLPDATRACCGHEYTLANPRFAPTVEPDDPDLTQSTAHCEALRAPGRSTLPSQPATERLIHPFLRSREATVLRAVHDHAGLCAHIADADVSAAPRQWKNDFR